MNDLDWADEWSRQFGIMEQTDYPVFLPVFYFFLTRFQTEFCRFFVRLCQMKSKSEFKELTGK